MNEFPASEELMKFFTNLIEIKSMIKEELDKTQDPFLATLYEKLDATFKVNNG
jgi:hypothetical protein